MSIIDQINNSWGILLFLAGLIFHALWTYFRVGNHDIRIGNLETGSASSNKAITDINNKISSIDAKLDILLTGYHKE